MVRKSKPEIVLEDYTPNEEECRYIIFRVIYQAITDYMNLTDHKTEEEQFNWESAKEFIFSDEYWVQWGDTEVKSVDLMYLANMDPDWVRTKVAQKVHPIIGTDGVITTKRSL